MKDIVPTTMKLNSEAVTRIAQSAQQTARMSMQAPDAGRMHEAGALAMAGFARALAMQKSWIDGWAAWAEYAGTLDGADTVPKYMERVGNICLRAQSQVAKQVTDMSDLVDGLSVNYAYWAAQQVQRDDD